LKSNDDPTQLKQLFTSAILPGLGQAIKKYWKNTLVYGT
jgi:hypothetical protein